MFLQRRINARSVLGSHRTAAVRFRLQHTCTPTPRSTSKPSAPKPPFRTTLPAPILDSHFHHPSVPLDSSSPHLTELTNTLLLSFLPRYQLVAAGDGDGEQAQATTTTRDEPLIACVTPIEGDTIRLRYEVYSSAALVGADVVRLDALTDLGFGVDGGLGEAGGWFDVGEHNPVYLRDESEIKGTELVDVNAGLVDGPAVDGVDVGEEEQEQEQEPERGIEEEDTADEHEHELELDQEDPNAGMDGHISGPFEIALPSGPFSFPSFGSSPSPIHLLNPNPNLLSQQPNTPTTPPGPKQDLLHSLITHRDPRSKSTPPAPRVILIENLTAMWETLPRWWDDLLGAVQRRRAAGGKTTVVISCGPSVLHVAPNLTLTMGKGKGRGMGFEGEPGERAGSGLTSLLQFMKRLREGAAAAAAAAHSSSSSSSSSATSSSPSSASFAAIDRKDKQDGPHWFSSDETDHLGRRRRLRRRLGWFQLGDERSLRRLLPPGFGSTGSPGGSGEGSVAGLTRLTGGPVVDSETRPLKIWRCVGSLPYQRDSSEEEQERRETRRNLNWLLIKRAARVHGIQFTGLSFAEALNAGDGPVRGEVAKEWYSLRDSFGGAVWPWTTIQHLMSTAAGHVLRKKMLRNKKEATAVKHLELGWVDLAEASVEEADREQALEAWKEMHKVPKLVQSQSSESHPAAVRPAGGAGGKGAKSVTPRPAAHKTLVDPVVEKIKKDPSLNQHEKRLLSCIVDHNAVQSTTFEDVAMEEKTKDAVRSTVSLPLLYPEAFKSGILASHSSQGVLLYGPPGTGKTHLSRALANESGSRMIAVTPADINDMYVGQSEARTKALFSLARRLSPCIIFIDEAESLLGSRGGLAGGNAAHRQVLTEFMQQMDGLTSAGANRKARISMVAATNRPFDMDEAVLRRLPRRLLVDLPTAKDREVILKILLKDEKLGEDVDLTKLAKDTDTYSGSDLKHLCVTAAMAALKESAPPPWKLAQLNRSSATGIPSISVPFDSPSGGPGTAERETIPQEPEHAQTLPAQAMKMMDPADRDPEEERPGFSIPSIKAEYKQSLQEEYDIITGQTTREAIEEAKEEAANPKPKLPERVLMKRHFDQALKDISPSSAEGSGLDELRKWASKFGEGGTERGKKGGYGAKFGFGDAADKSAEKESEYGRVRPEDEAK